MITNNIPRLDIAQTKSDDYSKFEEDEQVLIIKFLALNLFARNKRDSKAKSHLEGMSMSIKIKKNR